MLGPSMEYCKGSICDLLCRDLIDAEQACQWQLGNLRMGVVEGQQLGQSPMYDQM